MEIALKPWLRWQMLRGKNNGRPKKKLQNQMKTTVKNKLEILSV